RNYQKGIALGCVAAGGSLGILIPPSVTMIIYGLIANTSVGKLYAGGVLPGLLIALLFCVYIYVRGVIQPEVVGSTLERFTWREKLAAVRGLVLPILLVVTVLGSMLGGYASVSEAAAVGSFGSLIAAAVRRQLNWTTVREACEETILLSCLIFWII